MKSPALSRAFFCSTSCWRLDGLRVAPGAEDMLVVPLRGWFSEGLETSDLVRLKELEAENSQMERIIARQALEISAMKNLFAKKFHT